MKYYSDRPQINFGIINFAFENLRRHVTVDSRIFLIKIHFIINKIQVLLQWRAS